MRGEPRHGRQPARELEAVAVGYFARSTRVGDGAGLGDDHEPEVGKQEARQPAEGRIVIHNEDRASNTTMITRATRLWVWNTRHRLSCAPGCTTGGTRYSGGERTLRSSFESPASDERNGMSALPSPRGSRAGQRRVIRPRRRRRGGRAADPPGRPRGRTASRTAGPPAALFERLADAGAVTVVSAPAASGKTCLLRSWIVDAGLEAHAGWATVKPGERDGQRFWGSVLDALAASRAAGAGGPRRPGGRRRAMVERLLSALRALREPGVLVIDDLHELNSADGAAQLERFLTRLPAQLRVVLLTRDAMGLGLHRLRLAGAVTELRRGGSALLAAGDARAARGVGGRAFGRGCGGAARAQRGLGGGAAARGRPARGTPDPERFVREFSGSERTVAAYLRAEVLERQPAEVRDLLLRTSVLERVSGPLADALAGGSGSERILQELEGAEQFVTALDVGRSWFRYHPLFADLLRLELRRVNPTLVPALHASPVSGTSSTATWSRRSATPRPPATGSTQRTCSPTTISR